MLSIDIIDECVAQKENHTVTVGVFEKNQPRHIVFGGGGAIVAPIEHEYELCGATQCLVAALAQKLIAQGKLSLYSPLSAFLPEIPKNKDFTVLNLLTHSSGIILPLAMRARLAIATCNPSINPSEGVDKTALLEMLVNCKLREDCQFSPCEMNTAILGEMIAVAGGLSFREQILSLIKDDLRLTNFRLSNGKGSLQTPYPKRREGDSFVAANGLVANVNSVLRFLRMALLHCEFIEPCVQPVEGMKTQQGFLVGLGWLITTDGLVWQSGTSAGFNCFLGIDFANERAACVLSNTSARAHQSAAEAGLLYLREKQNGKDYVFMA